MKKLSFIIAIIVIFGAFFLTGCTHEVVNLYIYKMPNKLVYNLNEKLDLTGLELKGIKTDSALTSIYNSSANFKGFDSTTTGKKEVTVSYGKFTTSFTVFVANKVVDNEENLITTINNASDDDIILIKKGEYNLSAPLEINNKNLIISGEGTDKTKLNGFVIIGGYYNEGNITYSNLSENISIFGLTLNETSAVKNSVVSFNDEKYNYLLAGINAENIKGLKIISCKFSGFSTGIKIKNLENSFISGNSFTKLYVGGIEVTNSIKNSTISKNIINYIGNSIVFVNDKNEQQNIFGIKLAFNEEENVGVSLYKNSISKIAIKNTKLIYLNKKAEGKFSGLNYMNNSGAIIIHSSGKNNLQTTGLSIFYNSVGSTLNNILYSTSDLDVINSSSVNYMSF